MARLGGQPREEKSPAKARSLSVSLGHGPGAMVQGHGLRPWPGAMALGPWPGTMALGPWSQGHGLGATALGPWPEGLILGTWSDVRTSENVVSIRTFADNIF